MPKRASAALTVVFMLFSVFPCQVKAVSTSAAAAILVDADSGRVLYEQNADAKMLIASTTKIMTALVAIREGELSDVVTVKREATLTEGSSMYLKEGEQLTLETLLYGLMLCSGNDAAVAIAEHVGGSQAGFVRLMNETARELGMAHTSFANPNGLDAETHYSTARDMAVLACAAMENETFARIVSTRTVTIGGRTMTNHNKLLSWSEGCIGLKTGYTKAAGRTLVSCMEKNGQRLVAVTLQDGNDWADHQALYEYGFAAYPARRLAVLGQPLRRVSVKGGVQKTMALVAAESFSWPVAEGEGLETRLELSSALAAPLAAGTKVGQAVFTLDDTEIGRVDLLCGESVAPKAESALAALKLAR
ncbi:D-alanyl-D-alanine carboxypeptidase family protein [Dysosmobacter sp.]|uniref:D-alanyl-D-alanine carboxypeptidase family protein n=1 Tax=Dysosmobacter sp. TaxID=2591382 RepID=UPI002A9E5020|nr:D-alanyl-D-alanine carboxypeptidase family protein [Dysosmobacter sp.]MDY5612372.1 D-alanyl-D-alanine carboxypeptidase family protein [Dysosmobacter sp.]